MRYGSRWAFAGGSVDSQFESAVSEALLAFDCDALIYGHGLSDEVARDYAIEYARMLQNAAKGLNSSWPRIPHGLREPDGNLIRATLERMSEKYFPSKIERRNGDD
jgi:hypothetical protein